MRRFWFEPFSSVKFSDSRSPGETPVVAWRSPEDFCGSPSSVVELTEAPSDRLGGMVARAVSNPWLIFGVVLQASFFFIYLMLLTRADVSLVLPLTAIDYIVVAVLAQYMLGEIVTPIRWAGMGLIVAGVGLLSRTSS